MLISNVDLDGRRLDVRISESHISRIAARIDPTSEETVVDGKGGALLPGLHDHHIHLNASAAAMQSVQCGPPEIASEEVLVGALKTVPGVGWLRGVGFHASGPGEIDRNWLDRHGPDRPIRIQHRGGRMWIFNSRAIDLLGIAIPADGRLVDADAALRAALNGSRPDLAPLVETLLAYGVTGVSDTTPANDLDDLRHYADHCEPLRVLVMGGTGLHNAKQIGRTQPGPLKLHYHDHDLPPLDTLAAEIADAHSHGRAAAMHCVTRAEIMLALAAFEQAGPVSGDRLEHAAVADQAAIEWTARLGLTVVTQPHFVTERAEAYLAEVDPLDLPHLWPLGSFVKAGIALAGGSDAPFGKLDPWHAMASAVSRPDALSPAEGVTPEQALALYTKPVDDAGAAPRIVAEGEIADLCLLTRSWCDVRGNLCETEVAATWIDGQLAYQKTSSTKPHSNAV